MGTEVCACRFRVAWPLVAFYTVVALVIAPAVALAWRLT
jgi:hypothetical protein